MSVTLGSLPHWWFGAYEGHQTGIRSRQRAGLRPGFRQYIDQINL